MRTLYLSLIVSVSTACGLLDVRAAAAQYVRGTVLQQDTGEPVAGAMVVLVDEGGNPRANVLTSEGGAFVINARAAGSYSLRVQRIGFRDVVTAPFGVQTGATVEQHVRVTPQAIVLEGITAEARRRCELRPRQGLAVATLWGEARKALEAAQVTERQASYRFRIQNYRRNLDVRSLRVLHEESSGRTGLAERSPFVSLAAERLLQDGFVHFSDTATLYHAPDADVLLSDTFLDAYCFRIAEQRGAPRELIGLAFEPAAREGPPAVQGTLWLDRNTFELQHLEYGYTRAPLLEGMTERIGGHVAFEALPNGTWIVRRWRIRMPEIQLRPPPRGAANRRPVPVIAALVEEGGEVMEVTDRAGSQRIRTARLATLSGLVFDSAAAIPLSGAIVHLQGTDRTVVADEAGRFRMDDVREGEYLVAFSHPVTALYDYRLEPVPVSIEHGAAIELDLAVPLAARGSGRMAACSREARAAAGFAGVLTGAVTDEVTGERLPGATVTLSWEQPDPAGGSVTSTRSVVADREGNYVACGLPERTGELRAEVSLDGRSFAHAVVPAPSRDGIAFVDFTVRLPDPQPVVIVVIDTLGLPLPNVRITLAEPGLSGVTDRFGRVTFAGVHPGTHAVRLDSGDHGLLAGRLSIGSAPGMFEVHVPAQAAAAQDSVSVLSMTDLAQRTRGGKPNVVDREEIERVLPTLGHVGHLAQRIPGLSVQETQHGAGGVRPGLCVRSPAGARMVRATAAVLPCAVVVMDDVLLADTEMLLTMGPDTVEAIEFVEPADASRYGTAAGQVGALLVWTRSNGPHAQRGPR